MKPEAPGSRAAEGGLAGRLEHSVLAPEAGEAEVRSACDLVRRYRVRSLVVKPVQVALARGLLEGSGVLVVSVIGFPHGNSLPRTKAAETAAAVRDGADEIDMVIDIGALREGRLEQVREEIRQVVGAAAGRPVKVIIETALLSDEMKTQACRLAQESGAAYVKTSTGFSRAGATVEDVILMRRAVGPDVGVKASGGIRTRADVIALVGAGADLLGTSSTEAILEDRA